MRSPPATRETARKQVNDPALSHSEAALVFGGAGRSGALAVAGQRRGESGAHRLDAAGAREVVEVGGESRAGVDA